MSADRTYHILVMNHETGILEQKHQDGAYEIIASIIEDENSGITRISPEQAESKQKFFNESYGGQMKFLYEMRGSVKNFIYNIEENSLFEKYTTPNHYDNQAMQDAKEFIALCKQYEDLPLGDALIIYNVTN